MSSLLSVSDAQQRLIGQFSVLNARRVPLVEAAGRVLAEAVISSIDLPPFSNSSMDGFAVQAADLASARQDQPAVLRVVADIPAGSRVLVSLQPGQAARIMTGAPLPPGADAVIPVENTDFSQRQAGVSAPEQVLAYNALRPGENVRPQGMDVRAGEAVMQPGDRLRPQDIAFLAMLGVARVKVIRPPRVAIFSTGDELLPVDVPLQEGKIYDSNTYALLAQVEQAGGEALNLGIIPDRAEAVQACLDQAADRQVDLILSSAGVSVGAFDFVRSVVEQRGRLEFWRVNMRPGKPLAFGAYQGIPFIGLPGNPVSAFVGFEVFVRPALLKMAGVPIRQRPTVRVRLLEAVESDGRESYLRAVLVERDGHLEGRLTGHQGSGNLRSLVQANALVRVPEGIQSLPAGAELEAWLIGEVRPH